MSLEHPSWNFVRAQKVFPDFDELAKIWFREEQLREQLGL